MFKSCKTQVFYFATSTGVYWVMVGDFEILRPEILPLHRQVKIKDKKTSSFKYTFRE